MTARKSISQWTSQLVHESEIGEFRDIPGFGGAYKVSRDGIVLSRRRREIPEGYWLVLKQATAGGVQPYKRVSLCQDGASRPKIFHVSRLILMAWVGPPPSDKHQAAYRDGKPGEVDATRLDNLLWALPKDVKRGQICRGTWAHGEQLWSASVTREQVDAMKKIVQKHGVSVNLLSKALGIPQPRLHDMVKSWDTAKWDDLANPLEATTSQEA